MNTAEPTPRSLNKLNQSALNNAYELSDVEFGKADHNLFWIPEQMTTLFYLPIYDELGAAQKRRYNQLVALAVCEQFAWLEEHIVIRPLLKMLAKQELNAPLREALWHFVREEDKHTRMFHKLLQCGDQHWYRHSARHLMQLSLAQRWAVKLIQTVPGKVLAWIWAALLIEERSLAVGRAYLRCKRSAPNTIDPVFTRIHEYHLRDEARHCQLDQHLISTLYDPEPAWKRRLCARILQPLLHSYITNKPATRRILAILSREFPDFGGKHHRRALTQLTTVNSNKAYQRAQFSQANMPRTIRLLKQRPEFNGIFKSLPEAKYSGELSSVSDV